VPIPQLPDLRAVSFEVFAGALAVAAIVLVQGTGVAESAPNRDGSRSDANRDFMAQGTGNIASGFFRGMPVGGSVGQTALNVAAGARSQWAAIFSGIWMLIILIAFGWLVGRVAMPTLAAVLIVAAIGSLRVGAVETVWRTGGSSLIAMATTFLATLFLPVAAAVGLGVALSLLLQLNADAMDLRVVELRRLPDGGVGEHPGPASLPSHAVTVLDVYGSLLYAGARTLEARLPSPSDADVAVVVLRLRGRTQLGATALTVLRSYAARLGARGGRLYLSGLDAAVIETFKRAGHLVEGGPLIMVPASSRLGASTEAAFDEAQAWISGRDGSGSAAADHHRSSADER